MIERTAILKRDRYRCIACGGQATTVHGLDLDDELELFWIAICADCLEQIEHDSGE